MQQRQKDAIEAVLESLKRDQAVKAVFLKGSIARKEDDEYSDVDMYCMTGEEDLPGFLVRRLDHLRAYGRLIYHSEVNFVGPQVVAVFEDGLHFDLYSVTPSSLKNTDEILVLYDPEQYLENYHPQDLALLPQEMARAIDEFSFTLLEYEAACLRGDDLWATRLSHHLAGRIGIILRGVSDPRRGRLGLKRIDIHLGSESRSELAEALSKLSPSCHLQGVKALITLAEGLLGNTNERTSALINREFLDHMKGRIFRL